MAHGSGQVTAVGPKLHAAIIMDGNGRWAVARGKSRTAGHIAGADAVRRTVEAAPKAGIDILTLYAFSSDNWRRPPDEVGALMRLLRRYLMAETGRCVDNGVRVQVIGRRDRLAPSLVRVIESAEQATARGTQLHLRIAVDYSARDAILQAAAELCGQARAHGRQAVTRDELSAALAGSADRRVQDVDLLIRTGGEQRLSDFLLWECAYAELVFTPVMWPDFGAADLEDAVRQFLGRERRFGEVAAAAGASRAAGLPRRLRAAASAAPAGLGSHGAHGSRGPHGSHGHHGSKGPNGSDAEPAERVAQGALAAAP